MRRASQVYGTLSSWAQEGLVDLMQFAEDRRDRIKEDDRAQDEFETLNEVIETLIRLGVPKAQEGNDS